MKIGVLLTGTVAAEMPLHSFVVKRDWKRSGDSIRKNIIDCWDTEIETYLSVDCMEEPHTIRSLIEYYNPQAIAVQSTYTNPSHVKTKDTRRMVHKYVAGLSLMLHRELDFIITTRPDISLVQPLSSLNVDFNKFNFVFRERSYWNEDNTRKLDTAPLVCDNLFAFPGKHLATFVDSVNELQIKEPTFDMHNIYSYVQHRIGDEAINFMVDEQYSSFNNDIYTLDRHF